MFLDQLFRQTGIFRSPEVRYQARRISQTMRGAPRLDGVPFLPSNTREQAYLQWRQENKGIFIPLHSMNREDLKEMGLAFNSIPYQMASYFENLTFRELGRPEQVRNF